MRKLGRFRLSTVVLTVVFLALLALYFLVRPQPPAAAGNTSYQPAPKKTTASPTRSPSLSSSATPSPEPTPSATAPPSVASPLPPRTPSATTSPLPTVSVSP